MINRILVAVDDSPAGLAAARTAIALAGSLGAAVRAMHVLVDGELELALALMRSSDVESVHTLRAESSIAVLGHVAEQGRKAGLDVEVAARLGDVASTVLNEARDWAADLIVLGRSDRRAAREPYVGSVTREVLEFAEQPVLVVPVP